MENKNKILTIYAPIKTQEKFKNSWEEFNKKILGKLTQAEYLEYLLDNQNKEE